MIAAPRYLYALVFSVICCTVGGTLWLERQLNHHSTESDTALVARLHERSLEQRLDHLESLVSTTETLLGVEWKENLRFILPRISMVSHQLLQITEESKELSKEELVGQGEEFLRETQAELTHSILLHREDFGMSEAQVTELFAEKVAEELVLGQLPDRLTMLHALALRTVELVEEYVNFSRGRLITCDFGPFPVLMPETGGITLGSTLKGKIGVGSYSLMLDPAYVSILINGDTLTVNPDGRADFSITPSRRGRQELGCEVVVTNPLTGQVRRNSSTFTYEVR